MGSKGLWELELRSGVYKFAAGFILLMAAAALTIYGHDFLLKALRGEAPQFITVDPRLYQDYQYYIWSQWFGKNLYQMGAFMAVIFGSAIISGDKHRNNLQFLLSRPLSRGRVLAIKYLANFGSIAAAMLAATLGLYIMALTDGRRIPEFWLVESTMLTLAGVALLGSVGAYFSVVFDRTTKAVAASMLVALALSIPGFIPGAQELSLYYHMQGVALIQQAGFPWLVFGCISAVATGLYALARRKFIKLDL